MSSKPYKDWNINAKVYVGNLSETTSKSEVENAFAKYGALKNVWLARKPPGFAFVEFEDNRDAEDAVRGLDGTRIGGSRVRVEMSHGKTRRGGYQSSRRGYRESRDYGREPPRRKDDRRPPRRSRSRSPSVSRSRSRSPVPRQSKALGNAGDRAHRKRNRTPSPPPRDRCRSPNNMPDTPSSGSHSSPPRSPRRYRGSPRPGSRSN